MIFEHVDTPSFVNAQCSLFASSKRQEKYYNPSLQNSTHNNTTSSVTTQHCSEAWQTHNQLTQSSQIFRDRTSQQYHKQTEHRSQNLPSSTSATTSAGTTTYTPSSHKNLKSSEPTQQAEKPSNAHCRTKHGATSWPCTAPSGTRAAKWGTGTPN